ncbi:hypothetical protein E1218_27480 [Kribbella turkmenica]|uniref:Solute-binding protein family 5 domain-containing protein n=1 Tax=Kribbella turkmenica TaxID=2530375 RepID=A0A4R4WH54_9ACTN|nr:hypothetical protein E1218_27480 [Kribbella turkmenica]
MAGLRVEARTTSSGRISVFRGRSDVLLRSRCSSRSTAVVPGDLATVAQAPLAQGVIGAPKLTPYTYDQAKAKQLLTEAGYPNGFSTSMQWPLEGGPNIRALAQAMISDWAKIGVTVKPLEKERAQWLEDFGKLDWDMNLQTDVTGTGDADYTLARLYVCSAKQNGYCNPALDKLLLFTKVTVSGS